MPTIATCERCGHSFTSKVEGLRFCSRRSCQAARRKGALAVRECACLRGNRIAVEYAVMVGGFAGKNKKTSTQAIRVCLDCLPLAYVVEGGELNITARWCPVCGLGLANGAAYCGEHVGYVVG